MLVYNSYQFLGSEFKESHLMIISNFADHYLLFDFPGQVELFSLHSNAKSVIMKLIKNLNLRVWTFGELCI